MLLYSFLEDAMHEVRQALLPATEYQGDYMVLEVIGRILPLLPKVVYYENWPPFQSWKQQKYYLYSN